MAYKLLGDDTDLLHASFVLLLQSVVVIKATNNSRTATGKCCIISNGPHYDKLLNQDKSQNLKCTNKSLQLIESQQMPSYHNNGIQLMLFFMDLNPTWPTIPFFLFIKLIKKQENAFQN